jgi:hypothetical protein
MSHAASATTRARLIRLGPTRDDLVDAAFLLVLMALALVGFRTTFDGWKFLIVGLIGALLGIFIGHIANLLRQPLIAIAAMTVATFFLLGSAVALHSTALAGVLPNNRTLNNLARVGVNGWKDLLTTLPPVDGSGPLLVLPYMLGLLGGVGGFCLARRTRPAAAPVVAPSLALAAVILLGERHPAALRWQGAVFGAMALVWLTVRAQRHRPPLLTGRGRPSRIAIGVALVAGAAVVSSALGAHVPGAGSHKRLVLRTYVHQPYDVGQYPSPLAGFRKYTQPAAQLYDKPLFTVSGLAADSLVQLATLDDYNGYTWTADHSTGDAAYPTDDVFQRVGTSISNPASGRRSSYTVTIAPSYAADAYADIWLPVAGQITSLRFAGPGGSDAASSFRYNLETGTGVVPSKLRSGATYRVIALIADEQFLQPTDDVASDAGLALAQGHFLQSNAAAWSNVSGGNTSRVLQLGKYLFDKGRYSDGAKGDEQYLPGHYTNRLQHFVGDSQIVGDDEQYAAAYALMINQLGTPARVVLGARLTSAGNDVVKGSDIHAYVQVQLADGSWRAIWTSQFMNIKNPPDKQNPPPNTAAPSKIVPPPAHSHPRSSVDAATDTQANSTAPQSKRRNHAVGAFRLPAWLVSAMRWAGPPLLVVLAFCGTVLGLKARRRRRRRQNGTAATRVVMGWREVLDELSDLGHDVPHRMTRREQAAGLDIEYLYALAWNADAHVFGPVDPGEDAALHYWQSVDEVRQRLRSGAGRWRRMGAAVNPASLLWRRIRPEAAP